MEIGVRLPHAVPGSGPGQVAAYATRAEQLGFAGLWAADHLVTPLHIESPYLLAPRAAPPPDGRLIERMGVNLELLTTLAFVAAITSRIKLCTGVTVLPIRNPVLNARQLATIDQYSGGRLVCGVGVGWLEEEADAVGLPWARRGARAEEHIQLMRTLWTAEGELTEFEGEFWRLPPMSPDPRPVQRPIPILIGGHSEVAIDRAGRIGDGWVTSIISPDRLARGIARLREVAERHGRDPDALLVYASLAERADMSLLDQLRRFAELGVDHVRNDIDTLDELDRLADLVGPEFGSAA